MLSSIVEGRLGEDRQVSSIFRKIIINRLFYYYYVSICIGNTFLSTILVVVPMHLILSKVGRNLIVSSLTSIK